MLAPFMDIQIDGTGGLVGALVLVLLILAVIWFVRHL